MAKIKVAVGYIRAGGGHITLGEFLEELLGKDDRFEVVRFMHSTNAFESTNNFIPKYAPKIHEFTYFFSPRSASNLYAIGTPNVYKEVHDFLKQTKPDIVLSTHFALSMHFKFASKVLKLNTLIVNCMPDYGIPSKLLHANMKAFRADKIMVFEDWTREKTMQVMNLTEKDVLLGGFTPKKAFVNAPEKYKTRPEARQKLKEIFNYFPYTDIDPAKTTAIVAGGSSFADKSYSLLKAIANYQKEDLSLLAKTQYFIICGSDQDFFEKLIKKVKKYRYWSNFFPFAWVDQQIYAQIQYASDFPILGSIAPATLNEMLATECGPFIVFKTRPGQEIPHVPFIESLGFGEYMPEAKQVLERIQNGVSEQEREKFISRARNFTKEQAQRAAKVPDMVYDLYLDKNKKGTE